MNIVNGFCEIVAHKELFNPWAVVCVKERAGEGLLFGTEVYGDCRKGEIVYVIHLNRQCTRMYVGLFCKPDAFSFPIYDELVILLWHDELHPH